MVRELKIKEGMSELIKDMYENLLEIKRDEDGLHYITEGGWTFGPFERVFVDPRTFEFFICGLKGSNIETFQTGVMGIKSCEFNELSMDTRKTLRNAQVEKELEVFPNCEFEGEVDYYKITKNPKDPFAKKDGYVRKWLSHIPHHIFKTQEGKVFAVNPRKIKPFEDYKKFDTFEELSIYAFMNGFEFGDLSQPINKYLHTLFHKLKFCSYIPIPSIRRILADLKADLGVKGFQNLDELVEIEVSRHLLVNLQDIFEALQYADPKILEQCALKKGGYRRGDDTHMSGGGIAEIELLIKYLPSTVSYRDVKLTYKGKEYTTIVPQTEKVLNALSNPNSYDWQSGYKFLQDRPAGFEKIRALQQERLRKIRYPEECQNEDIIAGQGEIVSE